MSLAVDYLTYAEEIQECGHCFVKYVPSYFVHSVVVPFTLLCMCLILQLAVLLLVTDKSFDRTKTIK